MPISAWSRGPSPGRFFILTLFAAIALAACGRATATPATAIPPTPSGTPTLRSPSATPIPPTITATPTASPTSTPTPTPTPHPLTIQHLRDQEYPGGDIVIEETLEPGPNYDRYIASYQSEGLKIYALMTVPWGEKPATGWPAIAFNHGYIPPDQYRTTERYVAYVDGFARSGYVVFRSDYRGHADSEGRARGAYGSPDYTIDVLNAVAALQRHPDVDPERIGMWGHSMGGYITLRSMVVSDDIRAGVIWAGVVASYPDLLERWRRRSSSGVRPTPRPTSWRNVLTELFGSPEENPAFWDTLSANSYLEELSGPIQLHHGTGDDSVPYEFSETLYDQIGAVGGLVEYYEYPNDDHNLSNFFTQAMLRSIAFFDEHLKGSE